MKQTHLVALHKTATFFLFKKLLPDMVNESEIEYLWIKKEERQGSIHVNRHFNAIEYLDDRIYVFVLRNPLDILVSQYYSFGWTHKLNPRLAKQRPKFQKMTVDEYCEYAASDFKKHKLSCTPLKSQDNYFYFTYEEMVLDWEKWCPKFCKPFNVPSEKVVQITDKYKSEFEVEELTPEEIFAGEKRHKRKIKPGDHKDKLQQKTIDFLNEYFKDYLAFLNSLYPEGLLDTTKQR